MKIKYKLKLLLPLLIIVLVVLSYSNFVDGYGYKKQLPSIDNKDKLLMQDLVSIEGSHSIDTINNNIKNFIILLKEILLNVVVSNKEDIDSGIDSIGEFRDLVITGKGDYLSQIYLLSEINERMRSFIVINNIIANKDELTIKVRVYGKTE